MKKTFRRVSSMIAFAIALGIGGRSQTLCGQEIRGQVVDGNSGRPLEGVEVVLLRPDLERIGATLSDATGNYTLTPSDPGEYVVTAAILGYFGLSSPLFRVDAEPPVSLDFRLDPDPLELTGIEVEVDQLEAIRREVAMLGVRIDDLGRRFIDPAFVASRWAARNVGEVIQARALPGVTVLPEIGNDPPCVRMQRGRTAVGMWTCALVAVDGQLVNQSMLSLIPLEAISSIVVMLPVEATLLFGTGASAGVVVIITKLRVR